MRDQRSIMPCALEVRLLFERGAGRDSKTASGCTYSELARKKDEATRMRYECSRVVPDAELVTETKLLSLSNPQPSPARSEASSKAGQGLVNRPDRGGAGIAFQILIRY